MNKQSLIVGLAVIASLAACSKAPEKAAERMIESAIEKGGSKAKVDISEKSFKITTTDASGKTTQMEMSGATVTEAALGVPFYPGAKPGDGEASKISGPNGSADMIVLHSADPTEKIVAFYRDRLKAQSEGKQLMEMTSAEGGMLSLIGEKTKSSTQIHVAKGEKGTDVQITVNKGAAK